MKNHKIYGSIVGAILGFVFVITCTSPLSSDSNEVTSGGKYQIATTTVTNYIYEERLNDAKRTIRVMQKEFVPLVVNEFKRLMAR